MPGHKQAREAVLNYRYQGLRASNLVLRGSPGHSPRADWLATGGYLTEPDQDSSKLLIIDEKNRDSGESRILLQQYSK